MTCCDAVCTANGDKHGEAPAATSHTFNNHAGSMVVWVRGPLPTLMFSLKVRFLFS
jgi:hypothetical protein